MTQRTKLPTRREAEIVTIESRHRGGKKFHLATGEFEDGKPAELFVWGPDVGSHGDLILTEAATLLSIALQYGMPLEEYAANVQREKDGSPCTTWGEIIDAISQEKVG